LDKIAVAGSASVFCFLLIIYVTPFYSDDSSSSFIPEVRSTDLMSAHPDDKKIFQLKETAIGNKYKLLPPQAKIPNNNLKSYKSFERTITSGVERNVSFEFYDEPPPLPQRILDRLEAKHANPSHKLTPNYEIDTNYYTTPPPEAILLDDFLDVPLSTQSLPKSNSQPQPRIITADTNIADQTTGAIISEPSFAQNGDTVFMTWNIGAARSTNGGTSFLFVSPTADFLLCCDQDVVYSPLHDVWVWYRQGSFDLSLGPGGCDPTAFTLPTCRNQSKIGISTDNAATWCFFNIQATDIDGGLTAHWLDYPHMQVTKNNVYISTNIFDVNFGPGGSAVLRFDLNGLIDCNDTTFDVLFSSSDFNYTFVNGATDTMYFGTQLGPTSTEVFKWVDGSGIINSDTVTYTSYVQSDHVCTLSNGANPCGRSDPRIMGGYLANGVIGFVWDAAQGGAFSFPYLNHIRIDESTCCSSTISLDAGGGNPVIFSNSHATFFANTGANPVGNVAIGFFELGGSLNPRYVLGVDNSINPGTSFEFQIIKTSTDPPDFTNEWGDYVRVKSYHPFDGSWAATGYTLQGGGGDANAEQLYILFSTPQCHPPLSGDWTLTFSCVLLNGAFAPASVIIQNVATLTIPDDKSLVVDSTQDLTVQSGSGVLTQSGGQLVFTDSDVVIPIGSSSPGCETLFSCYVPFAKSITTGSTVTWKNFDTAAHTVTSGNPTDGPDGVFNSGLISSGNSFAFQFNSAGNFNYFCLVHPWQQGQIIVT